MTDTDVLSLPLPDAAARRGIARDLDVNLMVEAGAGSGKTTELVSRMIALLETGTAVVDEIAAVTFTRKAASELRQRFQTGLELRLAQERAKGGEPPVLERLVRGLDDIDRAFIGTIHAFCSRLLRERPLEVGLDPAFEELALEERHTVRRRFWGAYLERLTRDDDPTLEELAATGVGPASLYPLFDRVVENPDVAFPADGAELPTASELGEVRSELEAIVATGWELMGDRVPARGWDSLQKKIRTLHFTRDVTGWQERADLLGAVAMLCTSSKRGHAIVQNRWRDTPLAKSVRDRANDFGWGDTVAGRLVKRWYAHRYALSLELARAAAREFSAHRRRIGKLDFQDLLVLAAELLRTRPRVRRHLGQRYRRLLVDEFQDTDPLQAEIALLLASEPVDDPADEPAGAEGADLAADHADWRTAIPREGALFVVGDPKQSIYRFRRADIQLYGFVKERFGAFGEVVELTTNFRSRPGIGGLVNDVFRGEGFLPSAATAQQAAFEPLNTRPPREAVPREGIFTYNVTPERRTQGAAAEDDARRLSAWIRRRVDAGERQPGDFLLLTRTRKRLATYARALEDYGLPVQVTGAGVGVEEELRELEVVLESMIDPTHPVKTVAALVGLFFGIDYDRLVDHRLSDGVFDVMKPGDAGHPDVLTALRQLHAWWRSATEQPADVFVADLASELGLLPFAAAGELGALRAGALVYALDAVRAAALAGDASLPGALTALRGALDLTEAEAPLEPGRPGVVRLMNLHQAKGLEATVVVLADPSGSNDRPPDFHVERAEDGSARGYVTVSDARQSRWSGRPLAQPPDWDEKESAERRFDVAEEIRLLYVAVTRAREELVVVRWPDGPDKSPWAPLHPWLDEHAEPLDLGTDPPPPRARIEPEAAELVAAGEDADRRLAELGTRTYVHETVTDLAKADARRGEDTERREAAVPDRPVEEGFRGYSWGSAVHGALAAAAAEPGPEALRATCRDLLVEHGRPVDDHGEPDELVELLDLVREVRGSDLWSRAQRADRVLAEVPFATPDVRPLVPDPRREPEGSPPPEPQMELFVPGGAAGGEGSEEAGRSDPAGAAETRIVEGVIDLAFREEDGWVIADYKTDVGTDPDFAAREVAYRRQVDLYADAWSRLTGDPVKERVLFFTSQGRIDSW